MSYLPQETDEQYHDNAIFGAARDLCQALFSAVPKQLEGALALARLNLAWLTHEERMRYFKLERAVILVCTWERPRAPYRPYGDEPVELLGMITRGDL